jgi:hypothetical protein
VKVIQKLYMVLLPILALMCFARTALAAEPIDTDGPDFVDSSESIGKSRFQYEADIESQDDRRGSTDVRTTSTPILFKYGVTDEIDLRIQTDGYTRIFSENRNPDSNLQPSGFSDMVFGLKWHSMNGDEATWQPSASWIFDVDAPSGSKEFKGQGISPSLRSVMTWELPQNLSLGIMPGIKSGVTNDGRRFISGIFGVDLGPKDH